jgi:hypothetical protein
MIVIKFDRFPGIILCDYSCLLFGTLKLLLIGKGLTSYFYLFYFVQYVIFVHINVRERDREGGWKMKNY